jgi:hypothetical protein
MQSAGSELRVFFRRQDPGIHPGFTGWAAHPIRYPGHSASIQPIWYGKKLCATYPTTDHFQEYIAAPANWVYALFDSLIHSACLSIRSNLKVTGRNPSVQHAMAGTE